MARNYIIYKHGGICARLLIVRVHRQLIIETRESRFLHSTIFWRRTNTNQLIWQRVWTVHRAVSLYKPRKRMERNDNLNCIIVLPHTNTHCRLTLSSWMIRWQNYDSFARVDDCGNREEDMNAVMSGCKKSHLPNNYRILWSLFILRISHQWRMASMPRNS